MTNNRLATVAEGLREQRLGFAQQSGLLTVVPLFGPQSNGYFSPPLSGLKLSRVAGYGNVELRSSGSEQGSVAIVPLHMGYIQDAAQNHALCRSAFVASGEKVMFRDACCVQESQGGYLHGAEQWFFILPLHLREEALALRGQEGCGKLWNSIGRFSGECGCSERGHLEQIICRQRPYLTQYASRFELLDEQTGALFFLRDRLVGIEVAPSARYFAELWLPLVCFCYGTAAMREDLRNGDSRNASPEPFPVKTLSELRNAVAESRECRQEQLVRELRCAGRQAFTTQEEERFMELRLHTATSKDFVGQFVKHDDRMVYASIFGRRHYLEQVAKRGCGSVSSHYRDAGSLVM